MSNQAIETSATPGSAVARARRKQQRVVSTGSSKAVAKPAKRAVVASVEAEQRMTKQERVLMLLSRKHGATIEEVMGVTNWQQHSVRGFFAGTVKKKLCFELTSSRKGDEPRRYRIGKRAVS
jgi:hypothetical protein